MIIYSIYQLKYGACLLDILINSRFLSICYDFLEWRFKLETSSFSASSSPVAFCCFLSLCPRYKKKPKITQCTRHFCFSLSFHFFQVSRSLKGMKSENKHTHTLSLSDGLVSLSLILYYYFINLFIYFLKFMVVTCLSFAGYINCVA